MTTPNGPEDDWTALARAWTDPAAAEPGIDPAQIRALRRRDRLARLNFAAEMAGVPLVLGIVAWAVIERDLPWTAALACAAFALFAGAMTLWSRRGDPGILLDTPQTVVRTALAQARTGLRWAQAGIWTCAAGAAFLAVLGSLSGRWRADWPLLCAGAVFLAASLMLYLDHARRCRRRIAAHEAALAALQER
ncbi:hypothetical protein CFHF_20395 [Caulobacter flavus]|uniref:Uncharacterized protein n=1 Tax=Caulobacter flavus TaxID=1679497 RepID=A0A2N5CPB7_9CAUL|nr:hypothetical protein [Caulobacter flavus]AYV48481.1 hypothetical protein C1707_20675 [Caulobacter flavus]PLR08803.1 hypothetical protein CFHF_20395 [Caulobacter flavus]